MAIIVELPYYLLFFILWLISILLVRSFLNKLTTPTNRLRLPPSPPSLPVIGHLHHLTPNLHKSFHNLCTQYGPLLYLRFGASRCLLVSSASIATEIFKTLDLAFASRPQFAFSDKLPYGSSGFVTAPYGDYWRFMKNLCVTELLGTRQLERSRSSAAKNCIVFCRNCLSGQVKRRCSNNDDEAEKCRELVKESLKIATKFFFGDVFGPLKWLGFWVYGKQAVEVTRRYDDLLERILKEHEEERKSGDLMDILLEVYQDENAEDLFIASTETSAQAMQWTIAELVNHPHVFQKVREEIELVVGKSRLVEESDIPSPPYLQAVVKEALRLYPPGPVTTRECRQHRKIQGFDILEKTAVAINLYAIMRDPELWDDPDEFRPERFVVSSKEQEHLDHENEAKGQSFNFVPFGAGRRGCPGTLVAFSLMNSAVAAMVQCFDWKVGRDGDGAKVDMKAGIGMSLGMAHPLVLLPLRRMAFWHLFVLVFSFSGADATNFTLQNRCKATIWPGILAGAGIPQLMNGGLELKPGQTININAPKRWSGRFWGRSECFFDQSGKGSCTTGDCGGGALECAGAGGVPPATLAEFTLDSPLDFYDISLVDGYNIPLSITPFGGSGECKRVRCLSDMNRRCPSGLQVISSGRVVACKSACLAFDKPEYCCTGGLQ
ncbi:hypothetical protein F0562_014518 [Nyssa sinensis]|uniref:Uncharacterized protein n=1 Tax=Nyssa sinensis TaxID=561372 RepID=A0A5J4ZS45_9ASTE|nr:hypothetical protein F0562_014518 [Nyssa sinensis]